MEVDVVVVGAGISGLTAAYHLHKTDPSLRIIVLEAKGRVGGRTLSLELNTGSGTDTWDLGGQWVGSCQPSIMALIKELGLETYGQYIKGRKFMQLGGHQITSYTSVIPSLSFLALIDLQRLISKLEWMRKQVKMEDPYSSKYAAEWDRQTVASFLDQHSWTKGAREAVESASRCMFGAECSQMSLLYFVMYSASADGLDRLTEATEGSGQEFKVVGGTQQISQKMAASLKKDSVQLNQPVQSIQQAEESVTVTTTNGDRFKCSRVIVATPPNMTDRIHFDPMLPLEKRELYKRMPVNNLSKVIVTYKKAFWREAGISGEIVTNGGPSPVPGCDTGPLCIVYDATTKSGNAAIVGFLGGDQAVQWRAQDSSERKSAVLQSLSDFFGPEAWHYEDYREQDWGLEPYSEGSPVCSVSPGAMQYFAKGLRQPFNRLHFAGTESAMVWCGFMNGAVEAGLRAATEVLYHLRPESVPADGLNTVINMDRNFNYADTKGSKTKKSSRAKSVVKITLGLASVVLLGYGVKRLYEHVQS